MFKINTLKSRKLILSLIIAVCLVIAGSSSAQMITGVWKGKINKQKVEVKIILNGDNLTGSSYYYESANQYRRYSIKGYFDPETNEAVWWDDQLLEEKTGRSARSTPGSIAMLSRADFNCPGDGRMMLDGKAGNKDENNPSGDLHLDKIDNGIFSDEWDYVLDNYLVGTNDPDIIDSIGSIAFQNQVAPVEEKPDVIPPPVIIMKDLLKGKKL